jgi:adenylate cyclase
MIAQHNKGGANPDRPSKGFFIPIGGKLAVMILFLLMAAAVAISVNTTSLFLETSGKREEESNRSQAASRAAEINGLLESYIDKLSIIGALRLKDVTEGVVNSESAASNIVLQRDRELAGFILVKRGATGFEYLGSYRNQAFLKGYKVKADYLDGLNRDKPMALEQAFTGQPILQNRSQPTGVPLVSLAVPVVKDSLGRVSHVALADLPMTLLQRGFNKTTERTVYLVDKNGTLLAHPDDKLVVAGTSFATRPVVKKALSTKVSQGQLRYQIAKQHQFVIAAYVKCLFDLVVVSEASESVILEPAQLMRREVYYVSGVVISVGFFVAFLFSLTMTRPIERLVDIAGQIAKGNFKIVARDQVASRDEVGMLAWAFDGMLEGLRERDRVKSLFNKFHGSSVTENLLSSGEVKLGGMRKQVVVFFSDIRGFTQFSETRTPEDVVSMLNEYFSSMVRIIEQNGGVVDKFIGDAIMAVWGTPTSTGDDAYMAAKACLEMRRALLDLNQLRMSRGEEPIKIGMGLHCGETISGTVGSENRMEFTVIGDTVNSASRIEAATKAFGTDLLISQEMARLLQGRVLMTEAGDVTVKGKSGTQRLFKVRGFLLPDGTSQEVKTPFSDYDAEAAEKVKLGDH